MLIKVKGGTPNFGSLPTRCNRCKRRGLEIMVRYMGLSEIKPLGGGTSKFFILWQCPVCGAEQLEPAPYGKLDIEHPKAKLNPTECYYDRFGFGREVI